MQKLQDALLAAAGEQGLGIEEDFLKFFKNEATLDISREKILVILHNLAGDTASKQELVKEVAEMDRKRASGQLYADSLKQFLLRQRLMYTDLNAALTIVGSHGGKHRSAAYKEKEIPEASSWVSLNG